MAPLLGHSESSIRRLGRPLSSPSLQVSWSDIGKNQEANKKRQESIDPRGQFSFIYCVSATKDSPIPLLPNIPANQHHQRVESLLINLGNALPGDGPSVMQSLRQRRKQMHINLSPPEALEPYLSRVDTLKHDMVHRIFLLIAEETNEHSIL